MENVLGGYELVGRVGARGGGEVWKARDVRLGRDVALKGVPAGHPELVARLRDEAATLASLDDEHVVSVFGFFEADGRAYLVEQWIDGATVARVIADAPRLSTGQALGVVRGALLGLAHAHDRGVVHGDVSSSNVIVDLDGVSRLIDFGRTGTGTPAYRAPEVASGAPGTAAADVHAAAALLVHLLTGSPGAGGLARVDPGLQPVLRRALAPRPADRYPDARTFLDALAADAERAYGHGWWTQAGLGALVAPAIAVLTGIGGAGVVGAGAGPVVGAFGAPAARAVTGAGRSSRRLLTIGGGSVVAAVATIAAVLALTSGPDTEKDEPVEDDVAAPASGQEVAEPALSEEDRAAEAKREKIETLTSSAPTDRWQVSHTNRRGEQRGGGVQRGDDEKFTWTLSADDCTQRRCSGSISSTAGATYTYTWDGRALSLRRAPENEPKRACIDTVTGEKLNIAESASKVSYTYRYQPLVATGFDPSGVPTRMTGSVSQAVRYQFYGTCEPQPDDLVRITGDFTLTPR